MLGFASQLLLTADVNCRVQMLLMIAIQFKRSEACKAHLPHLPYIIGKLIQH